MPSRSPLPARTAQAAIILGFLLGTWMLMDGVHGEIVGTFVRYRGFPWEQTGPAIGIAIFGALWMLVPNLLLFQNGRRAWQAMVVLIVLTSWYTGPATLALVAMLILLLLPATQRQLRA